VSLDNDARDFGTPGYQPPEVIASETYDFGIDVFAFGMTMYAVLAGRDPFPGLGPFQIVRTILDGHRPKFPADTPRPLVDLAQRCWEGDPTRRPGFQEIISTLAVSEMRDSREVLSSPVYREYQDRITAGRLNQLLYPGDKHRPPSAPPDLSTLYINPAEYEEVSRVGLGAYGTVTKARESSTGLLVAMKKLLRADELHYDREVRNAASFAHPTILSVMGCTPFCEYPIIIMPFVEGGSLQDVIEEVAKGRPPEWWTFTAKMIILFGVAVGVRTLHERRVMHRDLKPGNVLLDGNHEPKISDFGCSKSVPPDADPTHTADGIGSPAYLAPEVFNGDEYDFRVDVFAFGLTMYAVLAGQDPFPGLTAFQVGQLIVTNKLPRFPVGVPSRLAKLAKRCWDGNLRRRPGFQEIIAELESPKVLNCSPALSSWAYREYRDRIRGD
jgi:serine/threonine protein kinase